MVAVEKPRGLVNAASLVALGTVASMGLSLVQQAIVARQLGVSASTDAFFMARNVSDLATKLLMTGHITSVFAPMFAQRWTSDRGSGWQLTSSVMNALLTVTLLVTVVVVALARPIVDLAAPGFDASTREAAVGYLRLLFPLNVFTAQAAVLVAVLNSLSRFGGVVAASVLGQLVAVVVLIAAIPSAGVSALVYAAATSAIATSVFLMVVAARTGYAVTARARTDVGDLKELTILLAPFVLNAITAQVSVLFYNRYASLQQPGDVTILLFGYRTFQMFVLVAVAPWLTVVFPRLNMSVAERGVSGTATEAVSAFRLVLFASIPLGTLLAFFAPEVVALLYERGEFGRTDTLRVASLLVVYAAGTLPHVAQMFAYRLCLAYKRMRVLNAIWITGALGIIPVYALLSTRFGVAGLAWSQNVNNVAVAIALFVVIVRMRGFPAHGLLRFSVVLTAGLVGAMAVSVGARSLVPDALSASSPARWFTQTALLCAAGLATFLAITAAARLEEAGRLAVLVRRRFLSLRAVLRPGTP